MKDSTLDRYLTTIIVLLAISIALMIYISNFKSIALDIDHYSDQFDGLDVYSEFESGTDLVGESQLLIDYLDHSTDSINTSFFNAKEKEHMIEVRGLFDVVFRTLDVAVILSVLLVIGFMIIIRKKEFMMADEESRNHFRKRLSQLLVWTGYAVLILAGVFVVAAVTFDYTFLWFHETFFVSDTWLMDPAVDNMVRMLPFEFFFNTFVQIVMMSVVYAAMMFVAGLVVGKDWRKKYKH